MTSASPPPPFHVYLLNMISLFKFLAFSLWGGCLYFRLLLLSGERHRGHHAFLVSLAHVKVERIWRTRARECGVVELKQVSGILGAKPLLP